MINFTKVISAEIDNLKRRIIKVLRYGKADVQTAHESMPFGVDSHPVKDLVAVYAETGHNGQKVIIGYINKDQKAAVGELRLYSTDPPGSDEQAYLWLKNNGMLELQGSTDNAVRFSKLQEGFNKLRSDVNALITEYKAHVHPVSGAATSTTVSILTNSTASIDQAKINEIKVP